MEINEHFGNNNNLIKHPVEKSREWGSIGGKASGESRRKRKQLKEELEMILNLDVSAKDKEQLKKMGIKKGDATYQSLMMIAMVRKAIKGDVRAAEYIRDTLGESRMDVELTVNDNGVTKAFIDALKIRDNKLDADCNQ